MEHTFLAHLRHALLHPEALSRTLQLPHNDISGQ
jgi:hypothetical protein